MSEQYGKLIIGLTGNIATGKSAVMRLAAEAGALTIDADRVAHAIMNEDAAMQGAIVAEFGAAVQRENGRIDRAALGEIVFNDKNALKQLEALLHPAVREQIAGLISAADEAVIMIEAIKLLDGPLVDVCHQVWVTRCDQKNQLDRLRVCRGMAAPKAISRIKAQSSQEDKVAMSDVVIDTAGLMENTVSQFELAWSRLPDPSAVDPVDLDKLTSGAPPPRPVMVAKAGPGAAPVAAAPPSAAPAAAGEATDEIPQPVSIPYMERPDELDVRRARPSDIPSILLLIQKATDGAVKMKRAELLMALSERGYFIGQMGSEITTILGWNIDSQIGRIDQLYIHPPQAVHETTRAVVEDVEKSANAHLCEIIITFLEEDTPEAVIELFKSRGYGRVRKEVLPRTWQIAITESQPEETFFMIKVLRTDRLSKRGKM